MADARPDRAGDVPYIVTLAGDAYDKPGCRSGKPIGLVVVISGACLEPPSYRFKNGGSGVSYLREGWSVPELGGVWADGKRSTVEIPVSDWQRNLKAPVLEVAAFAFLPPESPKRTIIVSVAGGPSEKFEFGLKTAVSHNYALVLPPELLKGDKLTVVFDTPDAQRPKDIMESPDTRLLGAGLDTMRIVDAGAR
jgi:hypothetical protein